MADDHIEGYVVPVHRSLTTPILLAGVPRELAIINGTFVAALGLGLHSWYAIPIGLFIHVVAVAATKKDDTFFPIFRRMMRLKAFYRA